MSKRIQGASSAGSNLRVDPDTTVPKPGCSTGGSCRNSAPQRQPSTTRPTFVRSSIKPNASKVRVIVEETSYIYIPRRPRSRQNTVDEGYHSLNTSREFDPNIREPRNVNHEIESLISTVMTNLRVGIETKSGEMLRDFNEKMKQKLSDLKTKHTKIEEDIKRLADSTSINLVNQISDFVQRTE
ncbi:uncharacterized protein [Leptinotarsa decemlineata]|uniref:uncharacterized protein n=1 Tax=Leptinotarsa decemlineata TaxID=7539 RepID=UPI000C2522E5|nr:uncharacterized protein LOC111505550 [Leptinotarsa decemlineata]XP_023016152.1 uncharacterized protein LOC111505550 [Leptinotarsa decemlineata]